LRVCHLTSSFPRSRRDSAGIFIYHLARALSRKGIDIEVISPHAQDCRYVEQWDGMEISRFPYFYPPRLEKLCYGAGILKNVRQEPWLLLQLPTLFLAEVLFTLWVLKKRHFDVLHAHWSLPQGLTGVVCKRFLGIPLVVTIHGSDVFGLKRPWLKRANEGVMKYADACTVNSRATERFVAEASQRGDIQIIPMGVDLEQFQKSKDVGGLSPPLRREAQTILFVGRLIDWKGVEFLIRAIPKVLGQNPHTRVLIIGSGPERGRLIDLAGRLNLRDAVEFKEQVPQKELVGYYSLADVFVLPSIRNEKGETEGLGVVLLEAMACGVPVIGSRVGGIPDIIKHGDTGLLIREKDPDDLSEKLILLLSDRTLRERLIQKGQEFVEENFSWDKISERFINTYQDVLKKRFP
jgi:teichuronic acid biosynthesis glycosyltransferase TuaC